MTNDFLKLLKPQNVFLTKKRIGPLEDGGYTLLDYIFDNCSSLYTYGVGYDSRFEEEFCRTYNKPAYLYDHTIGREASTNGLINYKPEGLGFMENCKDFIDHYTENNDSGHCLLKIDIEEGEYSYFKQADMSQFTDRVMGLSLEVHWIDNGRNNEDLVTILNKIGQDFILFHIHGNVWGDVWQFEGMTIPKVLELSFINRKFVETYEPDNQDYPIPGLDVSNNPNAPDCDLSFLKNA